jgi:hypothetical protein
MESKNLRKRARALSWEEVCPEGADVDVRAEVLDNDGNGCARAGSRESSRSRRVAAIAMPAKAGVLCRKYAGAQRYRARRLLLG